MTPDPLAEAMNELGRVVHHLEEAREDRAKGLTSDVIVEACEREVERLRARYNQLCIAYDPSGI